MEKINVSSSWLDRKCQRCFVDLIPNKKIFVAHVLLTIWCVDQMTRILVTSQILYWYTRIDTQYLLFTFFSQWLWQSLQSLQLLSSFFLYNHFVLDVKPLSHKVINLLVVFKSVLQNKCFILSRDVFSFCNILHSGILQCCKKKISKWQNPHKI